MFSDITKVAEEKLGNIRTVHSFAKEYQEAKVFASRTHELFLLAKKEV
jgi:ABC-type multidrug transport system fused ATPase/permease subunit